jgi:hypothetical protein
MGGKFISLPHHNVINSWSECDDKLQSQALSVTEHVWYSSHFNSFISEKISSHDSLRNNAICTHTFIMYAAQNKTQKVLHYLNCSLSIRSHSALWAVLMCELYRLNVPKYTKKCR